MDTLKKNKVAVTKGNLECFLIFMNRSRRRSAEEIKAKSTVFLKKRFKMNLRKKTVSLLTKDHARMNSMSILVRVIGSTPPK